MLFFDCANFLKSAKLKSAKILQEIKCLPKTPTQPNLQIEMQNNLLSKHNLQLDLLSQHNLQIELQNDSLIYHELQIALQNILFCISNSIFDTNTTP